MERYSSKWVLDVPVGPNLWVGSFIPGLPSGLTLEEFIYFRFQASPFLCLCSSKPHRSAMTVSHSLTVTAKHGILLPLSPSCYNPYSSVFFLLSAEGYFSALGRQTYAEVQTTLRTLLPASGIAHLRGFHGLYTNLVVSEWCTMQDESEWRNCKQSFLPELCIMLT